MTKRLFLVLLSAVALVSCTKSGADLYKGYYSFKTGGYVDITGLVHDTAESRDTSFVRYVANESGQMRVLSDSGDKVKVTFNVTGGAPMVFDGQVDGDSLLLLPQERSLSLYVSPGNVAQGFAHMMTVSGCGKRYDNTLIIDLDIQGSYSTIGLDGTVTASHVRCIAVENE